MSGGPLELVLDKDGKATLKPAEPSKILKPEIVVEAERQKELAKQRMHRQVALEMYCAEVSSGLLRFDMDDKFKIDATDRKAALDCCIELAGYLIEKTGGHQ